MAYEFKRLGEVEALSEVPENATVLAEVDGSIKRVPGSGLGGGSTLVITSSDFTNAIAGISTLAAAAEPTYTTNMTLTEALAAFRERKLAGGLVYTTINEMPIGMSIFCLADSTSTYNVDCLFMVASNPGGSVMLYWTADGISTSEPSSGK